VVLQVLGVVLMAVGNIWLALVRMRRIYATLIARPGEAWVLPAVRHGAVTGLYAGLFTWLGLALSMVALALVTPPPKVETTTMILLMVGSLVAVLVISALGYAQLWVRAARRWATGASFWGRSSPVKPSSQG
jgi:uncharacterized membrane protein YfcA